MANSTKEFRAALRTVIGAAWPDVLATNGGGGIWSDRRARKRGLGQFTTPYAVYRIPGRSSQDESVSSDGEFIVPISFYYVTALTAGGAEEDTLDDRLDAMLLYPRTHTLTAGDWNIGRHVEDDSELDLNKIAQADGLQLLIGRIDITCRYVVEA